MEEMVFAADPVRLIAAAVVGIAVLLILIIRMLTKNISGYVPVPVSQQPTLGVAQHHAWMPMAIE